MVDERVSCINGEGNEDEFLLRQWAMDHCEVADCGWFVLFIRATGIMEDRVTPLKDPNGLKQIRANLKDGYPLWTLEP